MSQQQGTLTPAALLQMLYDVSVQITDQTRFWMLGALQRSLSQVYRALDQFTRDEIKREYMVVLKERTERVMTSNGSGIGLSSFPMMSVRPAHFGKYALIMVSPLLEMDFPLYWPSAFRDLIQMISDATVMQEDDQGQFS